MRVGIVAVLCLVFVCGCSRIPEPAAFEYSSQSKLQAAHHWDVLALDIANQINNELLKDNLLTTAVYVKKTCGGDDRQCKQNETTEFDEAFHDLLVTQLVRFGIPTCAKPEQGAITVNYKVQTVYHKSDRYRTLTPGLLTSLTAAVEVLRNAPGEVVAVATAGAIDLANSAYVGSGHFEVIITTSMVSMRTYLFRSSNIYYINDEDFWQYQASNGKAKQIRLTDSDQSAGGTPPDLSSKAHKEPIRKPPLRPADKTPPNPMKDI